MTSILDGLDESLILRILDGMSPSQAKAVTSRSRFVRLVAGAGAGKTETLTRRIVLLVAAGVPPESIVAFTFTEKAAAVMKERVFARVRELLGADACRNLGRMFIGTMHSFAARVLQEHFGYGNYDVLDENQEVAFLLQNGWDLGLGQAARNAGEPYGVYCMRFLRSQSVVNDEMLDLKDVAEAGGESRFAEAVAAYWDLLDRNKLLTFGRMIRLAAERLRRDRSRLQVRHLIVDEYQDINRAQEELIDQIISSGDASCMVVGDPRQCIYEWRGSDPGCFARFASRGAESIDLLENRRSGSCIVSAANSVSARFADGESQKAMKAARVETGFVGCVEHDTPGSEAEWIARRIRQMVDGGLRYSDIAVLLRSVSTSGGEFVRAFEANHISYIVGGKIGLFERPEAGAMAALWLWFADHDWYRGYGQKIQASRLLDHAAGLWPGGFDSAKVLEFRDRMITGKYSSLIDAYYDLLARLGYTRWNPDDVSSVRMANLGRFSRLLLDFEAAVWRGGRRLGWETIVDRLGWYINTYAQSGYGEESPDDLPDVDAVNLSTVHQAKGLEWPVVFVPALSHRRFPSSRAGKPQPWLLSRDLFDVRRYEGGIESERRLFYVAITRARDVLVLSRFSRINRAVKPSEFWSEIGKAESVDAGAALPIGASSLSCRDDGVLTVNVRDVILYLRCPHQYRMRSIWGYEPELVRQMGFGRSIHHILHVLADYAKKGVDPQSVLSEVVDRHFFLPYETEAAMRKIKPTVEESIRCYLQRHGDILARVEEAETFLEFFLDQHATLTGRVDVVASDGQALEAIDYKTADDPRLEPEEDLQLQLYSLGLGETGRPVDRARVVRVLHGDSGDRQVPVDPEALESARKTAQKCLKGIIGREFPPSRKHCNACDVRKICCYRGQA